MYLGAFRGEKASYLVGARPVGGQGGPIAEETVALGFATVLVTTLVLAVPVAVGLGRWRTPPAP